MFRPPNIEMDNKSDSKRLAQRNATSYVFGSSTPRSIDLDLPALDSGLLVTPNRINTSDENWRRRPVSAYYSDDFNFSIADNTTETSCPNTTLNQRDSYKYGSGLNSEQARACLTMSDPTVPGFNSINGTISSAVDENLMSQSLVSIHGVFRGRRRHPELSPALPRERIFASSTDRMSKETNRSQATDLVKNTPKRAVSMTRLDQLAQPRRRYIEETQKPKNNLSALSPTRPISSMSSSTDGSEVKRRVKPTVPRKPRPLSIGSPYAVKLKVDDKDVTVSRDSRTHDKPAHPIAPIRLNRARSAGGTPRPLSLASPDSESSAITPKPTPPRKPAHVKAAAMARKAIKQSTSDASLSDKTTTSLTNIKLNKTISAETVDLKIAIEETPVPSLEPNETDFLQSESLNPVICDTIMPSNVANNSKKDVSADDYKKMMAEKRRLAREQAEREADADRIRIEKEQQEDDERVRREEEEQKRLEEEQLRLIQLQKQLEEERLRKAVEENQLREEEDNKRKAEEQRIRLEKEEKDKKAKQEAEKQRLELEERLRRDEEERLQRKKKLEAIMSRTRKTPANRGSSPTTSLDDTQEAHLSDHSNSSTPEKVREETKNHQNILKNEQKDNDLVIIKTTTRDSTNSVVNTHPKPDLVEDVNRAVLQNRKSESNRMSGLNGSHLSNNNNNNHIQNFSEQRLDDNMLDINDRSSVSARPSHEDNTRFDQLINLNYSTETNMEDVFNSNRVTSVASNTFISTNGSNVKSKEQTITDLLS